MVDLIVTVSTIVVVLAAAAIVFVALNRLVDLASIEWQDRIRPWVFILPALVFLGFGLVWPTVRTVYLSFRGGPDGENGFTFDNYTNVFTDSRYFSFNNWDEHLHEPPVLPGGAALLRGDRVRRRREGEGPPGGHRVHRAGAVDRRRGSRRAADAGGVLHLQGTIWNNLWWVVTVAGLSTLLGLMLAILADRANGEKVAKSLIFMPAAISFVGAAVIWRYVYYRNTSREDIGLLNNVLTGTGLMDEPIDFYTSASIIPWNNFFIMIIMIWIQVGFALVVLSAAVKSVPSETLEAARIDGASELQSVLAGRDPAGAADDRRRADDAHRRRS